MFLIDTPGFNDTVMEDADVLKGISAFLATVCVVHFLVLDVAEPYFRYQSEVKLAGVIYFHRISDERWRKSNTRSFEWLKRICGEQTLRNVVLMTNMWGNVDPEVGAARERELAEEFVRPALDQGAQLLRHYNTTKSAHDIIRAILNNPRTALQVQQELIDENREFDRTTLGEGINHEIEESARRLMEKVEELQNALATVKNRERERKLELEAELAGLQEEMKRHTEGSGNLNADYKHKKTKEEKRWASFFVPAGIGISVWGILISVVWYCVGLYAQGA